jgi:tetratricopeptide (TPR) repeat protein
MTKKLILAIFLFNQVCYAQTRVDNNSARSTSLSSEDSSKITELFFAGLKEKMAKNFDKSDIYYKQIIAMDPANDATLFELATSYHSQNLEKEAEHTVLDAISLKPANEWYWVLLADIYEKTNNLTGLLKACDELITIAPKKEDYYFDKASVLFEMNKVDEALAVYDLIEKKHGQSRDLTNARQRVYQKKSMTNMTAVGLEELIKSNPANLGNYIELSQLYYLSGYKDKALQVLQAAKKVNEGDASVRINLANIYRQEGQPETAYAELQSALGNPAMEVEAKINIVLSLSPQFKEPEVMKHAVDLSAILVKLNPANIKVRSLYGDVLLQDKKPAEARQSYLDALKLNNKEYSVWESLIRMDLNEADFTAAVKDADQALSVFPANASLCIYLGEAYFSKGDYNKAISYFKNAENQERNNKQLLSVAYTGLGDSYKGLKHDKESDSYYEKALKANPENAEALHKYASSLLLRGGDNLVKAEQLSHLALELEPDNQKFKNTFDRISFLNGKYKSAVSWVESNMGGLELSSQDFLVWENIIRIEYEISDFDALIENAEKTIMIFPDQATPYLYMGLTYVQKKNYEKAKEYFQKGTKIQKENKDVQALIYSSLGDLHKTLHNYVESDKAYEKALQMAPYNLYALNSYAYSLSLRTLNLDKAERMARQATDLAPDNSYFEDTYACVLFRQKKYKDARTWIEKAIKDETGNNPVLFEHYGDILSYLAEMDLAVQQWTKAKTGGVKSEKLERKITGKKYVQ